MDCVDAMYDNFNVNITIVVDDFKKQFKILKQRLLPPAKDHIARYSTTKQ